MLPDSAASAQAGSSRPVARHGERDGIARREAVLDRVVQHAVDPICGALCVVKSSFASSASVMAMDRPLFRCVVYLSPFCKPLCRLASSATSAGKRARHVRAGASTRVRALRTRSSSDMHEREALHVELEVVAQPAGRARRNDAACSEIPARSASGSTGSIAPERDEIASAPVRSGPSIPQARGALPRRALRARRLQ